MGNSELRVVDLHVSSEGKMILKGVNLSVRQGEVHAIMGPNGSGKSTLAYAIMGHPKYLVERGDILLDGESILGLTPDKRAKKGLFLAFQYPQEIAGVPLIHFLRLADKSLRGDAGKAETRSAELLSIMRFRNLVKEKLNMLNFDESFLNRSLNEGFSGGEKKRSEILQMAVLRRKIAILDETDSGLDIDSLRAVSNVINSMIGPDFGVLLITHYQRILKYVRPHFVHVMIDGKIALSGDEGLAEELEEKGYDWLKEQVNEGKV